MNEMRNLNEIAEKVRGVEDGVTNLIIPLLKDTIADNNLHNKRLFISNMILAAMLLIVIICSLAALIYQNNRYSEFLSQFEFEGEVIQDLATGDYGNIYNPTLNNQK